MVTQNATVLSLYLLLFRPSLASTAVGLSCSRPGQLEAVTGQKQSQDKKERTRPTGTKYGRLAEESGRDGRSRQLKQRPLKDTLKVLSSGDGEVT